MTGPLEISVPVVCAKCGADLEVEKDRYGTARVTPCKRCLDAAYDTGYGAGEESAL